MAHRLHFLLKSSTLRSNLHYCLGWMGSLYICCMRWNNLRRPTWPASWCIRPIILSWSIVGMHGLRCLVSRCSSSNFFLTSKPFDCTCSAGPIPRYWRDSIGICRSSFFFGIFALFIQFSHHWLFHLGLVHLWSILLFFVLEMIILPGYLMDEEGIAFMIYIRDTKSGAPWYGRKMA